MYFQHCFRGRGGIGTISIGIELKNKNSRIKEEGVPSDDDSHFGLKMEVANGNLDYEIIA